MQVRRRDEGRSAVSANIGNESVVVTGESTNAGGIQSNGNSDILVD